MRVSLTKKKVLNLVDLATKDEGDDGQIGDGAAVDDVLTPDHWGSAKHLEMGSKQHF
jgi:hypothetical protein